jgi:plasmid stabilization system protein ParE
MTYRVKIAAAAEREAYEIFDWLLAKTRQHAPRWLDGWFVACHSLAEFPRRCPLAPEAEEAKRDVRHLLYGTRSNAYRILFLIQNDVVHILHVRHGARRRMNPDEIEFPPDLA